MQGKRKIQPTPTVILARYFDGSSLDSSSKTDYLLQKNRSVSNFTTASNSI